MKDPNSSTFKVVSPFNPKAEPHLKDLHSKYIRIGNTSKIKRHKIVKVIYLGKSVFRIVKGRKVQSEDRNIYMDYDTFTLLGLSEGDLVTLESTNLFQRVILAPFQLFEPHERYQYLLVVFIALLSLILTLITSIAAFFVG